jgi:hypothetical protein
MRWGVERSRKIRIHGEPFDLLTGMSLSIVPPSVGANGRPYEWLTPGLPRIEDLPLVNVAWTRERVRRAVQVVEAPAEGERALLVKRARGYLATVEGAVSGQRGHDRTFRVACVLAQKFGLSFEEAWPLLKEWSELTCEPPWSDRELEHKLSDALKKAR